MKEAMEEEQPVHNCPVQGPDTPLVRAWNQETNQTRWVCIWCAMADRLRSGL